MQRKYFQNLESYAVATELELIEVTRELGFNEHGLIPVITQDATTKEVLMLAWMNQDTFTETLRTGYVTYWSRSRNQRWVKGQTSGHTQELVSLSIDCDGDAILCQVNQKGAACHTGRRHCFYLQADNQEHTVRVVSSQPTTQKS